MTPERAIFASFLISRIVYFVAGVRFDASPLTGFFQIVDPLLMRTRLLETLWYLHTQPPGFNLIVGLAVKFFPDSHVAVLHALYIASGAVIAWAMYRLMVIFSVSEWIAALLTILFVCSPGAVLFENFLMYEWLLTALFLVSAVLLYRVLSEDGRHAGWFFGCLAALMLIRALFHLGWYLAIAAFVVLILGRKKKLVSPVFVPFALVLVVYAKNVPIAGSFTSSTWMGFNVGTITLHHLTDAEHERLVQQGVLSKIGLIDSLEPLSSFAAYTKPAQPTGIPVLDQINDSTGRVNYNNAAYLPLHRYYIADAKAILLHYPKAYIRSVVRAVFAYFLPTGDFPFFKQNGPKVASFNRAFNLIVYGQWLDASDRKELRRTEASGGAMKLPLYTGTYLLIGLPALLIWSGIRIFRMRTGAWKEPANAVFIYAVFQIVYTSAVVNLLSCFENNRYRLPVDPFYIAILGMAIQTGVNACPSRSARRVPISA